MDFAKAMALGADGVAVSNCRHAGDRLHRMRACHTNNCPVGIATQKAASASSRLVVEKVGGAALQLLRAHRSS